MRLSFRVDFVPIVSGSTQFSVSVYVYAFQSTFPPITLACECLRGGNGAGRNGQKNRKLYFHLEMTGELREP